MLCATAISNISRKEMVQPVYDRFQAKASGRKTAALGAEQS
jgi:hypothetical protein